MNRTQKTGILVAAWIASMLFAAPLIAQDAQNTAGWIQELQSSDPSRVETARNYLLKQGVVILPTLNDARNQAKDPALKQALTEITERLQTRAAARKLVSRWEGERWYAITTRGEKVGWLRLGVQIKEGALVLSDEMFYRTQGQEGRILHTLKGQADEYLTPLSLSVDVKRLVKPWTVQGEGRAGNLVLRSPSKPEAEGATLHKPDFTTDFAVMRLVTLLPRTKGYPVSLLEMWEKPALQESVLKFEQEETLDFQGGKIKASRFTLSNAESAERIYWVDENGRLLKMRIYGRIEFVLTDEKEARRMGKNVETPQSDSHKP
jgi:hypothetical protein